VIVQSQVGSEFKLAILLKFTFLSPNLAKDREEEGPMPAIILLVDADSSNRSDWESFLMNQGYKVFAVENGKVALDECARIQPDLVLMDCSLPDIHGFEVCSQLKSDPLTRLTPVILMMPSADPSHISSGQQVGADDFWARPGSRWEALGRVQSILKLKSYIDQQSELVLLSLARSMEAKDPLTEGHGERVVKYALQLAESLELSENDLAVLRVAGLLHDIGKISVPDSVLFKPGQLSADEMAVMRQHPAVGESICAPLKSLRDVLPVIRHHHERMDGSGYPDGLERGQIPLTARILQIVDIYDL
jgi:putative two-component system response regulator